MTVSSPAECACRRGRLRQPRSSRQCRRCRPNGIGDAREDGADSLRLAFHVNKIPISAAIEGRGAEDMVALVLRRESARFAHRTSYWGKRGGHVEQHEEQRNREG